jgi:trigger factor|tara:strand:+ start:119 stop:1438 length:1320 start_codon:yes stop_codon:yes gene_type:complete
VKTDLQDVTDTRKTLAVTLEANEVEAEEKSLLDQFSKMAKIPGFRPGKAPLSIVRQKHAKDIAGELKQRVMAKAYQDGSKEAKVELVNVIDVQESEIVAGQDITVTFTIDVRPEFTVENFKGLELQGLSEAIEDKDIDEAIDGIRKEKAEFSPVEREAAEGDYVKFSHEGSIDGVPISEIVADKPVYAKMPQTWEEIGSDQGLIPGLGDQLQGLKTGDKSDLEVEFPADFTVEELQGKKAVYSVEILEVRERKLPEMDDAFFEAQQVKTLDELKERVKGWIEGQKKQERKADLRRQVSEKLTASVDFSLPESLVEAETENSMRQVVMENMQRGVAQDQLEANKEDIHAQSRQTAESRVKLQLILSQIAEKESVEVSDQDMSQFVFSQAYQSGQKPDQFVKELKKDQNRLRMAQQSVLFDKTLEMLCDEAKVSDSDGSES